MRWLWGLLLPVIAFADTSENITLSNGGSSNVNWTNGVGYFSYQTGYFNFVGGIPQYDPTGVLTLDWSLDVRMDCANKIGGSCNDPNGIPDTLSAIIGVGNNGQYTDTRTVLEIEDFYNEWRTYDGTEIYTNTPQAYDSIQFYIQGKDEGYWADYYGPKIRRPAVTAVYTSSSTNSTAPTGPDCSNPLNDPSCTGYWDAVAQSSVTDTYTDTVFGDEIEDFYFVEEPEVAPPVVETYELEEVYEEVYEELFDTPAEEIFDVIEEVYEPLATVEETYEPLPDVQEVEETTHVPTEKSNEPADLPTETVDVVSIALALVATTTTSTASDTSDTFEQVAVETVPNPTQAQEQSQEETPVPTQELASAADMQFEQDFNDAIGAGQSIGQFLSAQLPDFSRFDVAPPSQQEQRTTQRATQALQSMSKQDIAQSTEAQLEEMQESGGFSDQSLTVLLISNNPDFNQYNNISLDDRSQFYENRVIYRGNAPADNARALLRGSGTRTYEAMVDQQWQR